MKIHEIRNNNITIVIEEKGAELLSVKKNNDDFEYLWQGDKKYWGRRAPILFPIVGKLKDDTYYIDGKAYELNQHGFARDKMFKVILHEENRIIFELIEDDKSLVQYPYRFKLNLEYEITENTLITKYLVENTNGIEMPFSIGAHPAFNMTDKSQFEFDSKEIYTDLIKADGVDTNSKMIPLNNGCLDITVKLFEDDALVLRNTDGVVFKHGDRSITLDCTGFPYLGLWSKPTGAPYVCLEPWYGLGDLITHNQNFFEKEGVIVLAPKTVFKSEYKLTLE